MNPQAEKRIEYRGFTLEIIKEPRSGIWTLRYRLNQNSFVKTRFQWETPEEAEAHGKRMIDSLFG